MPETVLRTMVRGMAQQLGLAMMPRWSMAASGFTSGTTSGTLGSRRQAELLSITTVPAATAAGARLVLAKLPAENMTTSSATKASGVASTTWTRTPLKLIIDPAGH